MGSIECEECNNCIAIKWCTQCDDRFCQECWDKIHRKGNRHFHRYCKIDADGNLSPRQWDANGSFTGIYSRERGETKGSHYSEYYMNKMITHEEWNQDDHYIENRETNEIQTNHYGSFSDVDPHDLSNCSQHSDDGGILYYYNSATGESTYENPYHQPYVVSSERDPPSNQMNMMNHSTTDMPYDKNISQTTMVNGSVETAWDWDRQNYNAQDICIRSIIIQMQLAMKAMPFTISHRM